ncbi:MAG: D-sedoheptulose-7-phosphate isomerase [Bacillota bacterium]
MAEAPAHVLERSAGERVLRELVGRAPVLASCLHALERALGILIASFRAGGKLLVCGNGGSAADAEHIVGELMKGFRHPRPLPQELRDRLRMTGDARLAERLQAALPAIALAGASPLATAVGNDQDPVLLFAQQVLGYGRPGDVFLGLSTSGRAGNVVAAARVARALGLRTIALTGRDGGTLAEVVEVAVKVPAGETHLVQELHLPVYHALCAAVEEEIFGRGAAWLAQDA